MNGTRKGRRVDFESFSKWVALLALVLSIANIAWAWISQPTRDMTKRIDEVEEETDTLIEGIEKSSERTNTRVNAALKEHDRRLQRVEDDMRHLPTKEALHAVEKALAQVETKLGAISATVSRVDDYLRKHQ